MSRIAITIEYFGKNYCGWQKNGEKNSIELQLERAFYSAIGESVQVVASGRTDAGVNAYEQCAHVDLPTLVSDVRNLHKRVNEFLPSDIKIRTVKLVSDKFHARYNVKSKTYLYKCYNSTVSSPLRQEHYAWVNTFLDFQKIKSASQLFVGRHNFKAFCSSGGDNETFEREIISIDVIKHGDEIFFYVKGKGFLYNMVRLIVGSLIKVGQGKLSEAEIQKALESGDKKNLGEKMPPHGLYLYKVEY